MKNGTMYKNELIDIQEVTKIFKLSIETVRKYKSLELIESCKREGKKDLYSKKDIIIKASLIEEYKREGKSLKEIMCYIKKAKEDQNIENEIVSNNIKKILVIEDNENLNEMIQEFLRKNFLESELKLYSAKDGLVAIERAREIRPDLIILDIDIPIVSGTEVYKTLTEESDNFRSKFLFISGVIEYQPENTIFLQKPVNLSTLLERVEDLIGLKSKCESKAMGAILAKVS